jgi:multiple sugar transport system substrate-binding protein
MKTIKGITWDHPRGFDSIVASSKVFMSHNPGIRIEWHKRSLEDFGYQPLSNLVTKFDLLMIDHPFVGEAHARQLFIPLEEVLSPAFLDEQSNAHIGTSYQSYTWQGSQYALPIDASAQFSACNDQYLKEHDVPENWDEYMRHMRHSKFREKVIWPLCPTDLWCSLLTICAQGNRGKSVFTENAIIQDVFLQGLEDLKSYTEDLNKQCFECNPILALELLSSNIFDYSPLLFGYCNYPQVNFINTLSPDPKHPVSLMGGVGIAISAFSINLDEVSQFLYFLSDKTSMDAYFLAGGQPSLRSYWESAETNHYRNSFFRNTFWSMENAYMRPRFSGFHLFQKKASEIIHQEFLSASAPSLSRKIMDLYDEYLNN